jgi:hypothetical protein
VDLYLPPDLARGLKTCGCASTIKTVWILEEACGRGALASSQSHFLHPDTAGASEHACVFLGIDFGKTFSQKTHVHRLGKGGLMLDEFQN